MVLQVATLQAHKGGRRRSGSEQAQPAPDYMQGSYCAIKARHAVMIQLLYKARKLLPGAMWRVDCI
jgi:hypothetical protein